MSKMMVPPGALNAKESKHQTRSDATNAASRAIQNAETRERELKTARLKAARLARDAAAPPPEPKPAKRAAPRRKGAAAGDAAGKSTA